MADDEEEKVGVIAEEVSKKQKGNKNGEVAFFSHQLTHLLDIFPPFNRL